MDRFRDDLSTQYEKCSELSVHIAIRAGQKQAIWCQLQEKQIASMLKITKMAKKKKKKKILIGEGKKEYFY